MAVDIATALLEQIHSTRACMADVRALAAELGALSPAQIESALQVFVDRGDEKAVSRLLQVCAFNEVKLDAGVLCACIGVSEDILDSAPCFALQDEHAIAPLLDAASAEALSYERQCYAAELAAEITVKLGLDPQPVRKALWKLEHAVRSPETQLLVAQALRYLDEPPNLEQPPLALWSTLRLSELLPEHRPRTAVGGTYTVRRPVAKLGRNDPCHCGSGKKYKKCCYDTDQELLRDASAYEGATQTDLKATPGLVDDPDVIYGMRAHELAKLEPWAMSERQLHTGYQRALAFGLRELAFAMLLEWEQRAEEGVFDPGHYEDLIGSVLQAGDLNLARRIREHCGDEAWWRPRAIEFSFDLLEHPVRYERLESECRAAVSEVGDEEVQADDLLIRLAYDFAPRHPGLSITFARAAIASQPDRSFENEMLIELIRDTRVDLDLAPDGDPAAALFDWIADRDERRNQARVETKEIERLTKQLDETLAALDEKKRVLRVTEEMLGAVGAQLEKACNPGPISPKGAKEPAPADFNMEEKLRRLRSQVEGLKAEIGEQQAERRQLRKLLADERKKHTVLVESETSAEEPAVAEERAIVEPAGTPVLPEYTDTFRKRLATLRPALMAKAIMAVGRFASHEATIWQQTKALERLPGHYRIRLSIDYRLIVHWQPGKTLRILDVIPRQELESWIRRQG